MASENEVDADIVAAMRSDAEAYHDAWLNDPNENPQADDVGRILNHYANRIEAAWKREKAEIEANALAVGGVVEAARHTPCNAAAMRKALVEIDRVVFDKRRHTKEEVEAHRLATEALTVPARQCDVGTAEEQTSRYERFCDFHKWVDDEGVNACSSDCPLYSASECALQWAQTPYEAQEGGAK